jgi:hypothetical protein
MRSGKKRKKKSVGRSTAKRHRSDGESCARARALARSRTPLLVLADAAPAASARATADAKPRVESDGAREKTTSRADLIFSDEKKKERVRSRAFNDEGSRAENRYGKARGNVQKYEKSEMFYIFSTPRRPPVGGS